MAKTKLTDKEKKKIIADYVDCGNYSAVAKKYGVSVNTVKRTANNDKNTAKKVKQKKEENTLDMLAYLDGKKSVVQNIINNALDLLTKEKLEEASPRELMTVVAIGIDKFTNPLITGAANAKDNVIEVRIVKTTEQDKDRIANLEKEIDNGS